MPSHRQATRDRGTPRRALLWGPILALVSLVVVLGYLLARCDRRQEWMPGPEETSTKFLDAEVEKALKALRAADGALPLSPEAARRSLSEARPPLLRLRHYYLPLLQARADAYNAQRWYHLGSSRRAVAELASVEALLLEMSELGDPRLSRELDFPLEAVVLAGAALRAGRSDAPRLLESLSERINQLLLKGGLALHGTQLEG